jgi:hypothetical protein
MRVGPVSQEPLAAVLVEVAVRVVSPPEVMDVIPTRLLLPSQAQKEVVAVVVVVAQDQHGRLVQMEALVTCTYKQSSRSRKYRINIRG